MQLPVPPAWPGERGPEYPSQGPSARAPVCRYVDSLELGNAEGLGRELSAVPRGSTPIYTSACMGKPSLLYAEAVESDLDMLYFLSQIPAPVILHMLSVFEETYNATQRPVQRLQVFPQSYIEVLCGEVPLHGEVVLLQGGKAAKVLFGASLISRESRNPEERSGESYRASRPLSSSAPGAVAAYLLGDVESLEYYRYFQRFATPMQWRRFAELHQTSLYRVSGQKYTTGQDYNIVLIDPRHYVRIFHPSQLSLPVGLESQLIPEQRPRELASLGEVCSAMYSVISRVFYQNMLQNEGEAAPLGPREAGEGEGSEGQFGALEGPMSATPARPFRRWHCQSCSALLGKLEFLRERCTEDYRDATVVQYWGRELPELVDSLLCLEVSVCSALAYLRQRLRHGLNSETMFPLGSQSQPRPRLACAFEERLLLLAEAHFQGLEQQARDYCWTQEGYPAFFSAFERALAETRRNHSGASLPFFQVMMMGYAIDAASLFLFGDTPLSPQSQLLVFVSRMLSAGFIRRVERVADPAATLSYSRAAQGQSRPGFLVDNVSSVSGAPGAFATPGGFDATYGVPASAAGVAREGGFVGIAGDTGALPADHPAASGRGHKGRNAGPLPDLDLAARPEDALAGIFQHLAEQDSAAQPPADDAVELSDDSPADDAVDLASFPSVPPGDAELPQSPPDELDDQPGDEAVVQDSDNSESQRPAPRKSAKASKGRQAKSGKAAKSAKTAKGERKAAGSRASQAAAKAGERPIKRPTLKQILALQKTIADAVGVITGVPSSPLPEPDPYCFGCEPISPEAAEKRRNFRLRLLHPQQMVYLFRRKFNCCLQADPTFMDMFLGTWHFLNGRSAELGLEPFDMLSYATALEVDDRAVAMVRRQDRSFLYPLFNKRVVPLLYQIICRLVDSAATWELDATDTDTDVDADTNAESEGSSGNGEGGEREEDGEGGGSEGRKGVKGEGEGMTVAMRAVVAKVEASLAAPLLSGQGKDCSTVAEDAEEAPLPEGTLGDNGAAPDGLKHEVAAEALAEAPGLVLEDPSSIMQDASTELGRIEAHAVSQSPGSQGAVNANAAGATGAELTLPAPQSQRRAKPSESESPGKSLKSQNLQKPLRPFVSYSESATVEETEFLGSRDEIWMWPCARLALQAAMRGDLVALLSILPILHILKPGVVSEIFPISPMYRRLRPGAVAVLGRILECERLHMECVNQIIAEEHVMRGAHRGSGGAKGPGISRDTGAPGGSGSSGPSAAPETVGEVADLAASAVLRDSSSAAFPAAAGPQAYPANAPSHSRQAQTSGASFGTPYPYERLYMPEFHLASGIPNPAAVRLQNVDRKILDSGCFMAFCASLEARRIKAEGLDDKEAYRVIIEHARAGDYVLDCAKPKKLKEFLQAGEEGIEADPEERSTDTSVVPGPTSPSRSVVGLPAEPSALPSLPKPGLLLRDQRKIRKECSMEELVGRAAGSILTRLAQQEDRCPKFYQLPIIDKLLLIHWLCAKADEAMHAQAQARPRRERQTLRLDEVLRQHAAHLGEQEAVLSPASREVRRSKHAAWLGEQNRKLQALREERTRLASKGSVTPHDLSQLDMQVASTSALLAGPEADFEAREASLIGTAQRRAVLRSRMLLQRVYTSVESRLGVDGYGNTYFLVPLRGPLDFSIVAVLSDEFFTVACSTLTNSLLALMDQSEELKPRKGSRRLSRASDDDDGPPLSLSRASSVAVSREHQGLQLLRVTEASKKEAFLLLQVKRLLVQGGHQLVARGSRARKGELGILLPHPRMVELSTGEALEIASLLGGEAAKFTNWSAHSGAGAHRAPHPVQAETVVMERALSAALVKACQDVQAIAEARGRQEAFERTMPDAPEERRPRRNNGLYSLLRKARGLPRWASYTNAAVDDVLVFGNLRLAHRYVDAAMTDAARWATRGRRGEQTGHGRRESAAQAAQAAQAPRVPRGSRASRQAPRGPRSRAAREASGADEGQGS